MPGRDHRFPTAALAAVFVSAGLLAGCIYMPRGAAGIPADASWYGLPLSGWIAEGDIKVEAVSVCNGGDCPPGSVVAALTAGGTAARDLETALADPARMARLLNEAATRRRNAKTPATTLSARRIVLAGRPAVAVDMARTDGTMPVSAIVAGRRSGGALDVVLVVARRPDAAAIVAQGAIATRL